MSKPILHILVVLESSDDRDAVASSICRECGSVYDVVVRGVSVTSLTNEILVQEFEVLVVDQSVPFEIAAQAADRNAVVFFVYHEVLQSDQQVRYWHAGGIQRCSLAVGTQDLTRALSEELRHRRAVAAVQSRVEEILPRILEMSADKYKRCHIAIDAQSGKVVVAETGVANFWKKVYELYGEQWAEHVGATYVLPVTCMSPVIVA